MVSGTRGLAAWALGTRGSPPALWGSAPSVLSLGRYLYSSHLLLHRLDQTRFEKGENAVSDEPFCAPPPVLTSRLCLGCLTDVGPASPGALRAFRGWPCVLGSARWAPSHSTRSAVCRGCWRRAWPSRGSRLAVGVVGGPEAAPQALGQWAVLWGRACGRGELGPSGLCRDQSLAGAETGVRCSLGAVRQEQRACSSKAFGCRLLPHARGVVLAGSWSGSHPRVPDANMWACAEERPAAPLLTKQISPRLLKAESQTKMTMIARPRKKLLHTT